MELNHDNHPSSARERAKVTDDSSLSIGWCPHLWAAPRENQDASGVATRIRTGDSSFDNRRPSARERARDRKTTGDALPLSYRHHDPRARENIRVTTRIRTGTFGLQIR